MKKPKKLASFRLSEKTLNQLETLSKRYDGSQAQIIAVIVNQLSTVGDVSEDDLQTHFDTVNIGR